MTQTETALLTLLRSSLYGGAAEYDPQTDWDAVFSEARHQAVAALAAKGLPDTLTAEQRATWTNATYAQLASYVRYMAAQDELCRLFADKHIPMAILKGSAAAMYYPQPSLRTMGDIDFIVPQDRFDRANQIMREAGYISQDCQPGRHTAYSKNSISFELHHHFSYQDLDIEDCVSQGLRCVEQVSFDGHSFPVLPDTANGIVLLAHMREHLRCGLGLRQVIDWMMFVERRLDDDFWNREFFAVAQKYRIDTLAVTATRLCQLYLGLSDRISWCADADEALCELLMERILSSGNFGSKNSTGNLVGGVVTNIRKEGLFPYLQRVGERDWALYHRHRWLRPFAWLHEAFVFAGNALLLLGQRKPVLSGMSQSRDQYDMLKKLNLL